MRRRITIAVAAVLMTQAACFGSFGLTVKVWEFNRGIGSKWVQELLFLGLTIIPVYEVAAIADALVLNSIEFWSGRNPVSSIDGEPGDTRIVELPDGTPLKMVRESEDALRLEHAGVVHRFVRTDEGFVATDGDGSVLARVTALPNGDVLVSGRDGNERTFLAEDLAMARGSSVAMTAWVVEQFQTEGALAKR